MIEKPYFVILSCSGNDEFVPLADDICRLIKFETENDAIAAGNKNSLGATYGFEVFEIGGGDR